MTESLQGRVVVVSPHLDDGVFSLGATIAGAARAGARVEVLTVFGCDPESDAPANGWDSRGGFTTEGEAATARRAEDAEACRLVGAEPHWLSFRGGGYTVEKDSDAIFAALTERISGANVVLVPGFPLRNEDHAWLARLFAERNPAPASRRGHYVELPYAYVARKELGLPSTEWERQPVALADRLSKRGALLAYASQLRMLSLGARRLNLMLLRSEAISWDPA